MANPHNPPMSQAQATYYLGRQFTTPFRDAALLSHMRLQSTETTILELGCADGTLAISTYKLLRSLTNNPIRILAVDSSPTMVANARHRLDTEAVSHGADISNSIRFQVMDATNLDHLANIGTINYSFPRGVSVIIAMNLMNSINYNHWLPTVRLWISFLAPRGRLVFNSYREPNVWATAHLAHREDRRHLATINLAPAAFITQVEQETAGLYGRLMEQGNQVDIRPPTCTWMQNVLRSFARTSSDYPVPGIQINRAARFDQIQRRLCYTGRPAIIVTDVADQFVVGAVYNFAKAELGGGPMDWNMVRRGVDETHQSAEGFITLLDNLMQATGSDLQPFDAICNVISDHHDTIAAHHGILTREYSCQLSEASVLVIVNRN